jgi:uncharacterized membrane protein
VSRSGSETDPQVTALPAPVVTELWSRAKDYGPRVAPTGIWLAGALVTSLLLAAFHSPLTPLPGVLTILFIPGAAVMSLLGTRPSSVAARVVLAVCLSMMTVMVVGGGASLLGSLFGVAHPLGAAIERVIWIVVALAVLTIPAVNRNDPVSWILEGRQSPSVIGILTSGILVLISILGVAELNHTGDIHLAVFGTVLDVAVLVAGVVGAWSRDNKWPLCTLLYGASLALLLAISLRGGHLYGSDVQKEFSVAWSTARAGIWHIPANHDAYASMLSLTVLPAILRSVTDLPLLAFFQLVVPAILALLPIAMFAGVRSVPRWVTSGRAAPRPGLAFAVVSGIIVSSVAFSSALVTITRQAMATTMLAAIVMVLLDRSMSKRASQVAIGLLLVAISFTHYTTSYLVAAILLSAWCVSSLWERGLLFIPRADRERHRKYVHSRKVLNLSLVVVAIVAAFGWNLAITRNNALSAPAQAVAQKGVGLGTSTLSGVLPPRQLEQLLIGELSRSAKYIIPVPSSRSVPLTSATAPSAKGLVPSLAGTWNKIDFVATEGTWLILGLALLYGIFLLGRRRSYAFSSDLVGLGVTGLVLGGILRASGTLAFFYNPERAAIVTAILLAAPVTMFLEDLFDRRVHTRLRMSERWALGATTAYVIVLVVGATGLSTLLIGGQPPGSLSANDLNVENFAVSTQEFATASWLRTNAKSPKIVQSDLHGQLVLLSQPGSYDLVPEIVPSEVDKEAFIYLSQANLIDDITQADADNGEFSTAYRSTLQFFNQHFYVVYSTGSTRVYH